MNVELQSGAFEEGQDCIIVATSALELGIDVGELDAVIQIDAPAKVASFLQRMGRTGRRPGTIANCTFLALKEMELLKAAALLRLYDRGFVEPTSPQRNAKAILAHQLMALTLQQDGVLEAQWWAWLAGAAAFAEIVPAQRLAILDHMLAQGFLARVGQRLILGPQGQHFYGRRHYAELFAVFEVPSILTVFHGKREIGSIDIWFLKQARDEDEDKGPFAFVLGGEAWQVDSIDWRGARCLVKPAEAGRFPRWTGQPAVLSQTLCEAMAEVLRDDAVDPRWTQRAEREIAALRQRFSGLQDENWAVEEDPKRSRIWTFLGAYLNAHLAEALRAQDLKVASDNFSLTLYGDACSARSFFPLLKARLATKPSLPPPGMERSSKFARCLPTEES